MEYLINDKLIDKRYLKFYNFFIKNDKTIFSHKLFYINRNGKTILDKRSNNKIIDDINIRNNEIGIPIGFSEAKQPQIKAKIIKFFFFSL